jgi:hypothetical protein
MDNALQGIFWGLRLDMVAEVGALDPCNPGGGFRPWLNSREAKYLVMPVGAANYDTEAFPTKADARAYATDLAKHNGTKVVRI